MSKAALARQAFLEGRFSRASGLLPTGLDTPDDAVLELEIGYYLGHSERTRVRARRLLEGSTITPRLRSKVASVIAAQYADDGEFESSLSFCRRALHLAQEAEDLEQLCFSSAQLLERSCDQATFHGSLPVALDTRRYAIRYGDPRATANVHLTFGRLEGRVGHYERARRHFAVGRRLMESAPNLYLEASFDLDESAVVGLLGDTEAALNLAGRAAQSAKESGWSKGIVAAAANSAFCCSVLGRRDEVEAHLRTASEQLFQSPSYNLAFLETRAQNALAFGDDAVAERLLEHLDESLGSAQAWYDLSAQETLSRVLLRRGRWPEALKRAEHALGRAKNTGAHQFVTALQILVAEAKLGVGENPEWDFLASRVDGCVHAIGLTRSLWIVAARGLLFEGGDARALAYASRAARLSRAVGSKAEEADAEAVVAIAQNRGAAGSALPSPDLDAAVALLELGGHTHILAREAVAVIEAAGCVRAMALVARGAQGVRVVEARGWDERGALAAARRPGDLDVIPLGQHRDEPWELVVDPRPELDHRCTLVAIRKVIGTALTLERYRREEKQRAALWPAEALDGDPDSIWASEQTSEVLTIARRIAPTPLSVLLTGETGTGKEVLARTIHRASDRADRVFLPFNCTAVPRDMLESQLFGYRRGAFTGADASFPGVIRAAAGGTLFLDEIAEVGIDIQPKLLRFLETHEIHPLGEPHPIKVDVRVIAATNAPLEQLVSEGRLREDLFYRLNVIRLKLPPLRERREEIPPLVEHYLRKHGDEQKKGRLTLDDETLEYLLLYSWPGNVRQLANEVRRAVALAEPGAAITPALLSPEIRASRRTIAAAAAPSEAEVRLRIDQPLPAAVEYLEQTMVRNALDRAHGRVEEAAKLLGISRKGLFLKRRRWGFNRARQH